MPKSRKRKQQGPESEPSVQQEQASSSEIEHHPSGVHDGVDPQETTAGGAVAAEHQEDADEPQRQVTDAFAHFAETRAHFRLARTELRHARSDHDETQASLKKAQREFDDARHRKRSAGQQYKVDVQHFRHAKEQLHTARRRLKHGEKLQRGKEPSSPEAILAYLDKGLAEFQQKFREVFPESLLRSDLSHRGSRKRTLQR
ncbi:MAG: hypothetical protein Q9208_004089 [Pyrenodesmia sp. 3 TL-2023]